ncbi:MAG: ComF family protein [Alphaproteobacteria bacterium]|nr:ComF family protein [Alphaproteobacteria bacterium]
MFWDFVLNAFFPPVCPVCSTRVEVQGSLCPDCFARLEFVSDNSKEHASAVVYNETSRQLILALKYGDRLDLAPLLARLMYNAGSGVFEKADVITCVPLHWKRILARKYNQAAVLAAELSKLSGVCSDPNILKRIRSTPKQGSRRERFENVRGAFVLNPDITIQGKTVVLIDDVVTTGATANSCAGVLIRGGAKEVRLLTFARA